MARVAVLHNTLDLRGGADAVCLHVCRALARDHEVTLFTLSRTHPAELDRLFDAGIAEVDLTVRRPAWTAPLSRALDRVADRVGPQLPLRSVLLDRYVRGRLDGFDVAVSTANEFAPPLPSVQYVHFPQFSLDRVGTSGGDGHDAADGGRLNPLYTRLAGLDGGLPDDATVFANSAWTADVVESLYGRRPAVCFPPVDPVSNPRPWAERERGVVSVGRIAPDKRTLDAVRIVEGVRSRGYDLHLHLVGSTGDAYDPYVRRVRRAVREREWVTLHTERSREGLEELLATHRYGLGTKPGEHFGMAVAEYVVAGMVAFGPDSGGQVDVLDGRRDRLFGSVSEAVDRLVTAVANGVEPSLPRDRFAPERFHRTVRRAVADRIRGKS